MQTRPKLKLTTKTLYENHVNINTGQRVREFPGVMVHVLCETRSAPELNINTVHMPRRWWLALTFEHTANVQKCAPSTMRIPGL